MDPSLLFSLQNGIHVMMHSTHQSFAPSVHLTPRTPVFNDHITYTTRSKKPDHLLRSLINTRNNAVISFERFCGIGQHKSSRISFCYDSPSVNCSFGLILSSLIFLTSLANTTSGFAVESIQFALIDTSTPPPTFKNKCAFKPTILA